MMEARQTLGPNTKWLIGTGTQCSVYSQPWFPFWQNLKPANKQQREMKVVDLWDPQIGYWDVTKLNEALGYFNAQNIISGSTLISQSSVIEDRLVFTPTKNGTFSLKGAYRMLHAQEASSGVRQDPILAKIWERLWKIGGAVPRVKVFIWKALHNAIPVASVIHARIHNIGKGCKLCGHHTEDVLHMIFGCRIPRAVWYMSPLGLRADSIAGTLPEALLQLWEALDDYDMCMFANLMWAIWKGRCSELYGGLKQTPRSILISALNMVSNAQLCRVVQGVAGTQSVVQEGNLINFEGCICISDGSFKEPKEGGAAYVLYHGSSKELL